MEETMAQNVQLPIIRFQLRGTKLLKYLQKYNTERIKFENKMTNLGYRRAGLYDLDIAFNAAQTNACDLEYLNPTQRYIYDRYKAGTLSYFKSVSTVIAHLDCVFYKDIDPRFHEMVKTFFECSWQQVMMQSYKDMMRSLYDLASEAATREDFALVQERIDFFELTTTFNKLGDSIGTKINLELTSNYDKIQRDLTKAQDLLIAKDYFKLEKEKIDNYNSMVHEFALVERMAMQYIPN